MRYNYLGNSLLKVSELSISAENFDSYSTKDLFLLLAVALDSGINLISIPFYQNRDTLSKLGEVFKNKSIRNQFYIAGVGSACSSIEEVVSDCKDILGIIGLENWDIYQFSSSLAMDPHKVAISSEELIESGLSRFIGATDLSTWRAVENVWSSWNHGFNTYVYNELNNMNTTMEEEWSIFAGSYDLSIINNLSRNKILTPGRFKSLKISKNYIASTMVSPRSIIELKEFVHHVKYETESITIYKEL